jgi:hypothetical protein
VTGGKGSVVSARASGVAAIPRPEKFYFTFGKPIEKLLVDALLHRAPSRDGISLWHKILQKT